MIITYTRHKGDCDGCCQAADEYIESLEHSKKTIEEYLFTQSEKERITKLYSESLNRILKLESDFKEAEARIAELLKLIESAGEYIPSNAVWWDEAIPCLDSEMKVSIPADQPCAVCGTLYSKHAEYPGCFFFHISKKEAPRPLAKKEAPR